MVYIILGLILWFILYIIVYKVGLYIIEYVHKQSVKRWGTDISDYEYEKLKFKIFVPLYFFGIPILFFIGCIVYYIKGY